MRCTRNDSVLTLAAGVVLTLPFAAGVSVAQTPPAPVIASISPTSIPAGSEPFELHVNGSNFNKSAAVFWRISPFSEAQLGTEFLSSTQLLAMVPADLLQQPVTVQIFVRQFVTENFAVDSNLVTFQVTRNFSISTNCPLPSGTVKVAYQQTLAVNGGTPPYIWTLSGGSLPLGLSLSSNGVISGTPTLAATYEFTLVATDSQQLRTSKVCTISIVQSQAPQAAITGLSPTSAMVGSPGLTLVVGGNGFADGSRVIWNFGLQNAIELETARESNNLLRATVPGNLLQSPATVPIAVRVPVLTTSTYTNVVNFNIVPPLTIQTRCPLPDGVSGTSYQQSFQAAGGMPPYRWDSAAGVLPPGLVLSGEGRLSGTPSAAGIYNFSVRVTDSGSNVAAASCSLRVLGPFQASPESLRFRAPAQGPAPAAQWLSLTGAVPGIAFRSEVTTQGGSWLSVAASSDRMPASLSVRVNAAGLQPGAYEGLITITAPDAVPNTRRVAVLLTVSAAAAPGLSASPRAVQAGVPRGGGAIQRVIQVANPGAGDVAFTAEAVLLNGSGWLSLGANQGVAREGRPFPLPLRLDPSRLAAGSYRGLITLRAGSINASIQIPVVLGVSVSPEALVVSQNGLLFQAVASGAAPPAATFHVLSAGANNLFWQASTTTDSGGNWLKISPAGGTSLPGQGAPVEVSVDPTGLAPDQYFGEVRIAAATDNSPRLVRVALVVLPAEGNPGPAISPAALLFTAPPGSSPAARTIRVTNLSRQAFQIDSALTGNAAAWNVAGASARMVAAGETAAITVTPRLAGLAAGVYRSSLVLQFSNDARVRTVELVLVVAEGSPLAAEQHAAPRAANGQCTPTRLVPAPTALVGGFTAPGGLPLPLEAAVVDDCGQPLVSGTVTASFTGDASSPVELVHIGGGRWSGTWQPLSTAATPVVITFTAQDPNRNLSGEAQVGGDLQSNDGAPVLADGGIVSAASFASFAPLAPGSLAALFGSGLATGSHSASGLPLPPVLGNTRALIGGREVPLFFAGEGQGFTQVNGMLPYDLPVHTSFQVAVRRGTRRSNFIEVVVAEAQPGLFSVAQNGAGQGVIVDGANQSIVVNSSHPATRGGVVVIYAEGLGAVNQPLAAGQAVPPAPLAETIRPVTVTIGGRPAQVLFSGLTPFFTGLYQINAVVPADAPTGAQVPVVVSAGGQSSNTVTLAVQ